MNIQNYYKKVMGCWLRKAVGGTLGQAYERCDGPIWNMTFRRTGKNSNKMRRITVNNARIIGSPCVGFLSEQFDTEIYK